MLIYLDINFIIHTFVLSIYGRAEGHTPPGE
jgi:hypothetical protein